MKKTSILGGGGFQWQIRKWFASCQGNTQQIIIINYFLAHKNLETGLKMRGT